MTGKTYLLMMLMYSLSAAIAIPLPPDISYVYPDGSEKKPVTEKPLVEPRGTEYGCGGCLAYRDPAEIDFGYGKGDYKDGWYTFNVEVRIKRDHKGEHVPTDD